MKLKTKERLASIIAFFLGLIFITAGIEKLTGIQDIIGPHDLIKNLAEHNLELLGKFIAYSQVTIGFLLITNRFRTIGAIMLLPMLLNILVVTIALKWTGTPYVVGGFLFFNVILLLLDFNRIKFVLSDHNHKELKQLKIKRVNLKIDIYYFLLLVLIYIGAGYGWTKTGARFANSGLLLILLSMLTLNIYHFIKNRRIKTNANIT
jgi:uncharacterized membrane protein YphA (DoxX/SURF4 family)